MKTGIPAAVILALLPHAALQAQSFPSRPVRIIVPFAAGGNVDHLDRGVWQLLSASVTQQVFNDNSQARSDGLQIPLTAKFVCGGGKF